MNEGEVDEAVARHKNHPILGRATRLLSALRDQVNQNSDGWAYWKKPLTASKRLIQLIQAPTFATEMGLKAAVTPIKTFCTKNQIELDFDALLEKS